MNVRSLNTYSSLKIKIKLETFGSYLIVHALQVKKFHSQNGWLTTLVMKPQLQKCFCEFC